jgi:hypothetical protein
MRARVRAWLAIGATVLVSTVLGLAIVEIGLRLAGQYPAPSISPFPNEPTLNVPDPVLGWRVKPGVYRFPGYTRLASPIAMTFERDGARDTRPIPVTRDRRVVLIGDSFTQGWAVSDAETYAWKLQTRFPDVEFLNYGTAGYNGLQALLRLEEHLAARPTPPPALVVYGFNEDQERRNVASSSWVSMLANGRARGTVRLPYCSLDDAGSLKNHPPESYPTWPLRRYLASVTLLERAYFELVSGNRDEHARRVTELLIDEMDRVARAGGSRFLVAILSGTPSVRAHYASYLRSRRIEVVDCDYGGGLLVRGEGHPNGDGHTKWAECLAPVVAADLGHPAADPGVLGAGTQSAAVVSPP